MARSGKTGVTVAETSGRSPVIVAACMTGSESGSITDSPTTPSGTRTPSGGDLSENVDQEEPEEKHCTKDRRLPLLMGFDQQLLDSQVEQGGRPESQHPRQDRSRGIPKNSCAPDRADSGR